MHVTHTYAGVWTAIVTPFHSDGSIDWKAFERLVVSQEAAGIDGLVLFGTTGESPTLSVSEKVLLIEKAVAVRKSKIKLMAGAGGQCTKQTLELAQRSLEAGADSLLIVTPPYNKPNPSGMLGHYRAIAEGTSAPICLYHVPGRTNQRLSTDEFEAICSIPQVSMVKEASGDLALFSRAKIRTKALFLSGDDPTFLGSLAIGGEGVISVVTNVFPEAFVALQKAFFADQWDRALKIHNALLEFIDLLFCETNPCPTKVALAHMGLCEAHPRLPLGPVSSQNQAKIIQGLEHAKRNLKEIL